MSQPIDYEKQFQDDLEKAQALSLESLALDKFRMQKKLEKLQIQISKTSETTSNEPIIDNIPQTENAQIISRPRPGSFNTGQPKSILAPPPISQRRNSTTSVSSSFLGTEETDLISFTSPTPAQSSFKELCDEIQKLNQQVAIPPKNKIYKTNMNFATSHPSTFQQVKNTASAPTQQASFINIPQAPNYGFQSHITAGLSLMPGVKPINQSYLYPSLTPQIPPLPSNYTPCNEPQLCLPSTSNVSNSNVDILKALSKQNNSNLIDLTPSNINDRSNKNNDAFKNSVRVSVLEIFDPLLTTVNSSKDLINKEKIVDDTISECSGSMYDEYDPFDYLHSNKSDAGSNSDPIYAAVVKSDKAMLSPQSPPPLPPRASWTTLERKKNTIAAYEKKKYRLYENVTVVKHKMVYEDCEIRAFYQMVKTVREKFVHSDESTNPGLIISPTLSNRYKEGTSIKITVYPMIENVDVLVKQEPPVSFTCDVSCSVEHVTVHVLCELDMSPEEKHVLQIWGATEYLAPETTLADYEYVHQCIKLEKDIMFSLVPERYVDYTLKRTLQDDKRDNNLKLEELLNNEPVLSISYDALKILLETLEMEMEKIESIAADFNSSRQSTTSTLLQPAGVVQSVKAVCTLMGTVETPDITEALEMFISGCMHFVPAMEIRRTNVLSEDGDYSVVALKNNNSSKEFTENIVSHCERIRAAVQGLIEMYCNAFRVDFKLNSNIEPGLPTICVSEVLDTILIRVCALHRIPSSWKHADYVIGAQVYHGTRPVGSPVLSLPTPSSHNFYTRVVFNSWLDMEGMSICRLAREARLVLVLYGRTLIPPEKDDTNAPPKYEQEEICWGAVQFFNYEGVLTQGGLLLSLWPSVADKRLGPAPYLGSHPLSDHPLLGIELPGPATRVLFPQNPPQSPNEKIPRGEFSSLDDNTQQLLLDFIDHDMFSKLPVESREVLWEKRHYLYHLPLALPKVLLAAHSWDWACLADLHAMLHSWAPMTPVQSLQLLLPCFPDIEVRRCAMHWMKEISNDELIDYLPQLVQALKYETYDASALARFLLDRALMSPRVAHHLYWLLAHNLPGQFPQNSTWDVTTFDEVTVSAARYYRRITLMLRALLSISGKSLRHRFMSQQILVKNLQEVAENIQQTKESLRLKTLCTALDNIHQSLEDNPTCLPLSPGLLVSGIQVWTSSYFPSNTLPLKINFIAPDTTIIPAIFKVGDDLQQDMLTLQMVRIMDKLWLREGLDLKMVAFGCMPTGFKRGMIEMVTEAETLRKIQVEWGLTGSFKDKPIAEWLAKHNPTELEYGRAVENFTASCAGYSVVTYLLGICDRHNDNIMLKTSGHMFHIDFGKFLGDAQMFGNFKRDRAPFVLTSDMVYVINGGDRPSARFHHFVDLCCQAFNIVRRHGNLILLLLALMASSGIPGVTMDAVTFVSKGLMLEKSNAEAASLFARLIESSLKSKFTQFNFFLHNLAQLRFTGDHTDGELLSFVPKTYSVAMDGRLLSVQVLGYQKRYDPDKHYVYIIGIERLNQPDPSYVLRSYKEFTEFHQKLCLHFPLAKIYSLPTGLHMGRSNIKQVAAKRKTDIELFLKSLFLTADEIAHSELVYTFFHPLLRDQQPIDINCKKLKEKRVDERSDIGRVKGELKLSVIYERGVLSVMVQHARNLPLIAGGQEPSTYVKVYLLPDPSKATKRKTLVVKRSCHPTFMEMLEYRLPLDLIKHRLLQATIWNHDPLQENEFLGGVELRLWEMPLEQEETHWFPLNNITRK